MAVKTFAVGELVTASDANTYLANSGLVYVAESSFTNVSAVQINNCFPTTFTRFRVVFSLNSTVAGTSYSHFRLSASGTPNTSGYYSKSVWYSMSSGGSSPSDSDQRTDRFCLGPNGGSGSQPQIAVVDIYNPNIATHTSMTMNGSGAYYANYFSFYIGGGAHTTNAVYDGIYYFPTSNNVTGKISIYGYRDA